jgi:hypothetical protein
MCEYDSRKRGEVQSAALAAHHSTFMLYVNVYVVSQH